LATLTDPTAISKKIDFILIAQAIRATRFLLNPAEPKMHHKIRDLRTALSGAPLSTRHRGQWYTLQIMRFRKSGQVHGRDCDPFSWAENINEPHVWVFPELVVCLNCGVAEFAVPETELRLLTKGRAAGAE
jgi:hypothetical protein